LGNDPYRRNDDAKQRRHPAGVCSPSPGGRHNLPGMPTKMNLQLQQQPINNQPKSQSVSNVVKFDPRGSNNQKISINNEKLIQAPKYGAADEKMAVGRANLFNNDNLKGSKHPKNMPTEESDYIPSSITNSVKLNNNYMQQGPFN
jgi:hypothetical protein